MKVRITGAPAECEQLLERHAQDLEVREVSGFYVHRPPSTVGVGSGLPRRRTVRCPGAGRCGAHRHRAGVAGPAGR